MFVDEMMNEDDTSDVTPSKGTSNRRGSESTPLLLNNNEPFVSHIPYAKYILALNIGIR